MKHVPPPTDGESLTGLALQIQERETALHEVAVLRKTAAAQIDRLIAFLDACDPYVVTELEEECEDEGAQCEGEGEACEDGGADCENAGEPSLWQPRPQP